MYKDYVDVVKTGERIKNYIKLSEYTVKDIQKYLGLRCPQSIYRWGEGISLPTIGHLYMLSKLFDVDIEDFIVVNSNEINKKLYIIRKER